MYSYCIAVPITGFAYIDVEAESESEAIERAVGAEITRARIEEWRATQHVTAATAVQPHAEVAHREPIWEG